MRNVNCMILLMRRSISLAFVPLFSILFFSSILLHAQEDGKKNVSVSVKVLNQQLEGMNAHIEVINSETKDEVLQSDTDNNGTAKLTLNSGETYIVFFTSPGFLYRSITVTPSDKDESKNTPKDVVMEKLEVGKRTILQNVVFDLYQKILIDESLPDIDRVVKLLNDMPKLRIEVGGFTDNFGSVSYSLKVSEQRATALVDLLISRGIDKDRLEVKAYGSGSPIATNFTEEGRALNNRVELKIMQLDYVAPTASEVKKAKKDKNKKDKKDPPPNNNTTNPEDTNANNNDVEKVEKPTGTSEFVGAPDSLLKMDFKGMFIADKAPLANSTVNLLNDQGKIFQTTKTDKNGTFEFAGVPATQDLKFELDEKETKNFKKIFLADTAGTVLKELDKVDGEFVLSILPAEKIKLGRVYLEDPQLKLKKFKGKATNAFLLGKVIDDSGLPVKADVEIIDFSTGLSIQKTVCDSKTGDFSITLPSGKTYDVSISKTGYSFQTINVEIPDIKGFERNLKEITIQKVEAGKKIVLNNIVFEAGKATLGNESHAELDRALKLLNSMQTLSIEISGHTDNVGSSKSNKELSEQRAKAVVDYLLQKGADTKRLTYKGYGASQPIASNKTEEGRQKNRRTEFKVLEVNLTQEADNQNKSENNSNNQQTPGDDNAHQLSQNLMKYDTDHNGTISYEEILSAIDNYFENYPKGDAKIKEELSSLFDYYFEK